MQYFTKINSLVAIAIFGCLLSMSALAANPDDAFLIGTWSLPTSDYDNGYILILNSDYTASKTYKHLSFDPESEVNTKTTLKTDTGRWHTQGNVLEVVLNYPNGGIYNLIGNYSLDGDHSHLTVNWFGGWSSKFTRL